MRNISSPAFHHRPHLQRREVLITTSLDKHLTGRVANLPNVVRSNPKTFLIVVEVPVSKTCILYCGHYHSEPQQHSTYSECLASSCVSQKLLYSPPWLCTVRCAPSHRHENKTSLGYQGTYPRRSPRNISYALLDPGSRCSKRKPEALQYACQNRSRGRICRSSLEKTGTCGASRYRQILRVRT